MLATIAYAVADTPTPPRPTLFLNTSTSLTVGWTPPATPTQYQLHLEARRRDRAPVMVTKQAAAGIHSLFWDGLPENSRCCFRVAAVAEVVHGGEVRYSEETCFNSCSCDAYLDGGGGGAGSVLFGMVLGVALTLGALAGCTRFGGARGMKQLLRLTGGYSGLTTSEVELSSSCRGAEHAEPAQLELAPPHEPGGGASGGGGSGAAASALPAPTALPAFEQYPMIEPSAFERQWSACAAHARALSAPMPGGAPLAPEEIELALTHVGLMCIAAGSVGASHKSYYAAQLRDGGDWLMLELVLHWEARAVHATFRCGDPTWLTRLADHFASHLGRALRVNFAA